MLPDNLLNAIKALALTQNQLPSAETAPKSGRFEPGQKLQGVVQAQISPGVFNVRIADQLIQMQLPAFIRSGDTVKLQVIATTPRLSFSMSASTNPLSTPESLGSVARLLSALSQQPSEKAYIRTGQSSPLWTTSQAPQSTQLASLLREALGNSGLFYESHQAQWLEGSRSTAQLMLEPQNTLPVGTNTRPVLDNTAPAASQVGVTPSADAKTLHIPEHLQPLVQQQLNALETRQVLWHGNIWPGQAMEWEIHDQAPQTPDTPTEQQQWATQIRLDLPKLGMVSATLRFNSAGLSLTLDTNNPSARAVLGNTSSQLVAALSDRGIAVVSTLVTQGGVPHAPSP